MIAPGDIVIAGVSGGADSMCLLDVLQRLATELGFKLRAAHFEHGIRGDASLRDALFVEEAARVRRIELATGGCDVPLLARRKKMSLEEAARVARYDFFEQVAAKTGPNARIALGHTAGDQAETVLMRLLRGSGLRGLGAVPPVRGPYIRPLIEIERGEVIRYLKARGMAWREDESNLSPDALRNRIRHELLPRLEADFNPKLVDTLRRTADACRMTVKYMDEIGERIAAENATRKHMGFFIERKVLAEQHPAVTISIVEALWRKARGNLRKLSFEHRMQVLEAVREGRSGIFPLPDDWVAAVDSSGVLIAPGPPHEPLEYRMPLEIPGETRIESTGTTITAEVIERGRIGDDKPWLATPPDEAYLDLDEINAPVEVRSPAPGDRMRPLGSGGSRKLQDIFTDRKVPRWARKALPVIVGGDKILWVAHLRIAHQFRVTDKTERLLHLKCACLFDNGGWSNL